MTTPDNLVRRARPWLGTIVEIGVSAEHESAIETGVAEIARIHRLMSFHEATSDLAKLREEKAGELVEVDGDTVTVRCGAEDQEKVRARFAMNYDRSYYPEGALRQWAAVMASPPRTEMLKKLNCPTLVIHGDADILIHPDAGRHTAACIKGAELKIIPGWGHNMPIAAVSAISEPMIEFMRGVERRRA